MMRGPVRIASAVAAVAILCALPTIAGGLYFGIPIATLDVTAALAQVPIAVGGAFTALEDAMEDGGVPPSELADIHSDFEDALASIAAFTDTLPPWIPLPLVGGGVEIGLPLLVIDGIRLSGGILSDELLRSMASVAGLEIPRPLVSAVMEVGDDTAQLTADIDFSSWILSTEAVKRFDVFLLALSFGAGVDLFGGEVTPVVAYDVPTEMADGVNAALAALHLNEISWSSFAAHGAIGFELGPPFFRLYGDVRWMFPLSQSERWWGIRSGPLSALLGFVIRF
jgi:hypothetical protein